MISKSLNAVAADSNVLLSAVIGKAALKIFTGSELKVFTTQFNIEEIKEYIPYFSSKYNIEEHLLLGQLQMMPLIIKDENFYQSQIKKTEKYLKDRDPDDIHLGALAFKLQIPIWSNDKDLNQLPIDVYPTAKLLKICGM